MRVSGDAKVCVWSRTEGWVVADPASAPSDDIGISAPIRLGALLDSHDRPTTSFRFDAVVCFPADRCWTAIFRAVASPDL